MIRRRERSDDQGFSLMEVMVGSAIMSVVLAVVMTATIQIYSGTTRIDQTAFARDQLDVSFRRMDRDLRYATWVSAQTQPSGVWTLRYALPSVMKNGAEVFPCRQLTVTGDVLAVAAWDVPSTTPGPPMKLATGVIVDSPAGPFQIIKPDTEPYAAASPGTAGVGSGFKPGFQQIRVVFTVRSGNVTLPFNNVFTSLNINLKASKSTDNDCS